MSLGCKLTNDTVPNYVLVNKNSGWAGTEYFDHYSDAAKRAAQYTGEVHDTYYIVKVMGVSEPVTKAVVRKVFWVG